MNIGNYSYVTIYREQEQLLGCQFPLACVYPFHLVAAINK